MVDLETVEDDAIRNMPLNHGSKTHQVEPNSPEGRVSCSFLHAPSPSSQDFAK